MNERFRTANLHDLEELPAVGGALRWKPVRRALGITAFGTNAYAADAGQEVVEEHDEVGGGGAGGHEELYVVVTGHAQFTIDGEELDAPAGTLVFLPEPSARRAARAVQDGTVVLAVGGQPGVPFEVSPWEDSFMAEAQSARGDHDGAIQTMREGMAAHPDNASMHYNLACFMARAGRVDEALEELLRAEALAPEKVRGWAQNDADLAPLRSLAGFPYS